MSKHFKGILFFAIFALSLVLVVIFVQRMEAAKLKATKQAIPGFVIVQPVKSVQWQNQVNAVGTLVAIQGITIKSTVNGIVTGIFFRSGQYVQAGQALFQINPGLDRTQIRAPFSGQIGLKQVDLGDYVRPGVSLVDLEDLNPMKVQFAVPQTYIGSLALGQAVTFTIDAFPNKVFTGKIFAIDAELDANTRSLNVWASVPNPNNLLAPGTYADVTLFTSNQKPVIVVPQTAISYSYNQDYVYLAVNGKAVRTPVTIGDRRGNDIEILKGVKAGDMVVTVGAGMQKFDDGAPLIPVGSPVYQKLMMGMQMVIEGKMTQAELKEKEEAGQKQAMAKQQAAAKAEPAQASQTQPKQTTNGDTSTKPATATPTSDTNK